ncbi:MAG: efflux RND transporter permease subunit [Chromatiaceae bacterium]|nr:MAG: efflux RND transporter permease subunit [Chromatiaceae bacterium]
MPALVRFTLRQQVLFNLVFVLLMVIGGFLVSDIAVERYPDVNFGRALIETFYPGASPEDVEALVTRKLEDALEGLQDVEFVQASSVRERSSIQVKFIDDSDYDRRFDELRFRILGALGELPEQVEPPTFTLIDTSFWLPVVSVNLVGERSNRALHLIAEELQLALLGIHGVDQANIVGTQTREFHVTLDPDRLTSHGVTFDAVAAALQDANRVIPAGTWSDASGEFVVRVDERFRTREQVLATIVRRDADGSFVTVADLLGSAMLTYRDPFVINSVDGRDTVAIQLIKGERGNALDIIDAANAIIAERAAMLAREGIAVTLIQDSSVYIADAMATLGWNMILGILLVGLILWYFLGPRNAGLVSIGIPFAFLTTASMLWLSGNSLNEITLFAFVLVSGILVDDAIVVTENIYRHVQAGEPLETAIVNGTSEVMLPVVAATATTVVAFLPMLMMTGATGEFFALVPKTVSFAIIASLFECLLILPLHYLDFGPRHAAADTQPRREPLVLRGLRRLVDWGLTYTLRWRWTSLLLVCLSFASAVAILLLSITGSLPLIRIQFFPADYNLYYVAIAGPPDTPLATIDDKVRSIARRIMADGPGYARSAAGYAGFIVTEDHEREYGRHLGNVLVALPVKAERAFTDPAAHLQQMRERMIAEFGQDEFQIEVRAEHDGPPAGKDVNIRVIGNDDTAVAGLADALATGLRAHPGFGADLMAFDDGRTAPARVLRLAVDARRAQELGLTQGRAAAMAAAALDGRYIGNYRASEGEVDLKLRIDPAWLADAERALDLPVLEHARGPVRLGDIVRLVPTEQPSELHRYRGQRSRTITANIRPGATTSPATVVAWARAEAQTLGDRYAGASLVFGGEFETTQRSFNSLLQAFGLAVMLIYLILAAQFRSYVQPLIVLSSVLFAVIGVVFGKLLTQAVFTVNSFVAVVGVTGVVVNGALVLLDFINRAYAAGRDRHTAIRQGLALRLRPIFLTTLTTTLGLLPMALGIPSYSVVWGSMATTFVTGLATASLLTLFVVPVGWDLLTEWQERRAARRVAPVIPAPQETNHGDQQRP